MKTRKTITYDQIKATKPCYAPEDIGIKEGYEATIKDFIAEYRDKVESKTDIIWVLGRKQYMTEKDMRLFAVWCARESLKLVDNPDPRSVEACNVAEKYANGEATDEELAAARAAASNAARTTVSSLDWAAARSAAWAATEDALWAIARGATWATARSATWTAAWTAARDTDRDAARHAAEDKQIDQLLTYF